MFGHVGRNHISLQKPCVPLSLPAFLLFVVVSGETILFVPACHSKALRSFFGKLLSSSDTHFPLITMISIFKALVLSTLAISVSALTTPHAVRNVNHHRGVAAALATTLPEPAVPQGALAVRTVRRRSSGRCKPKSSSASSATSAATPAANIEGGPPSVITTTSSAKPTHKAAKATHTSSDKPATPSEDVSPHKPASSNGGNLPSYMKGTQTGQGK